MCTYIVTFVRNESRVAHSELEKARKKVNNAKAELNVLQVAYKLVRLKPNVERANVGEERLDEVEVRKATTSWREVTLAKFWEETSATMNTMVL